MLPALSCDRRDFAEAECASLLLGFRASLELLLGLVLRLLILLDLEHFESNDKLGELLSVCFLTLEALDSESTGVGSLSAVGISSLGSFGGYWMFFKDCSLLFYFKIDSFGFITESLMNETSENREIPDVNNSDYNTLVLGFPDATPGLSGTALALSAELPPTFGVCSSSGAGIRVALNSIAWRGLLINFWALSRSSLLLGRDPEDRTPLDLFDRIDSPI